MNWITADILIEIHDEVLKGPGGGEPGILHPHAIETAAQRPLAEFGGVEAFPDLWLKIAALVHSIITSHPFLDGNKRTAFAAADFCLALNGHIIAAGDDEQTRFFLEIAEGKHDVDAIAEWLRT
ncbi:MAG: type II toxin-antitoxin system death-on-curing family toxin [Candidatus Poribacteria bacterium]|nr:type II toxin-antitoxin system death-on-curing family toxin [Candidatus Poribacteria bacterium]